MITSINFTVNDEPGYLGKIAVAMIQIGCTPVKQSIVRPDDKAYCIIKFDLEADHPIKLEELEAVKNSIPEIINIESEQQPVAKKNMVDISPLLVDYGKQLISEYPHINYLLETIENKLDEDVRDEVLCKLGRALGKWQFKKNYALGSSLPLDKTLQRMVWPSLEEFLHLQKDHNKIRVSNCPHCDIREYNSEPNCPFIIGYINGFLGMLPHLSSVEVRQISSRSSGGSHCAFEVVSSSN